MDIGGGIERMEKWSGMERTRVLPRNENLTSIVHVNISEVRMITNFKLQTLLQINFLHKSDTAKD